MNERGMMLSLLACGLLVIGWPATGLAQGAGPEPAGEPFVQARFIAEMGFLAPLEHSLKFDRNTPAGTTATDFDLVAEGGQDNLFLFARLAAELELDGRHVITFLYQPLELTGRVTAERPLVFDAVEFPTGTPLEVRYGFPFYRLSYMYDFLGHTRRHELALGTSMQIRNATIVLTAVDGSQRVDRRDIGPVPLIKLRGRYGFPCGFYLAGEVDGIWAPISYINGSDSDTEGALIDLNLQAGFPALAGADLFFNLRYLAGGATSEDSSNWLHFLTVSLGVNWCVTDLR